MKTAIIIGAGPAGLAAAMELLDKTDIKPVIVEAEDFVGGIACTIDYKGNKMDMGGHRFFTKSERVNTWWRSLLPPQSAPAADDILLGRPVPGLSSGGADPEADDEVMLSRPRISRIYYLKRFFDYPVKLNMKTIRGLGTWKICEIGLSYLKTLFFKRKEKSLEDFFINRFGNELYLTFFKDYTEKLWGIPCCRIAADWGAQRVKGISIWEIIKDIGKKTFHIKSSHTETSLIENFSYPKFGPGQLWNCAAQKIIQSGGQINLGEKVTKICKNDNLITAIETQNAKGERKTYKADYFFSSMPVKDLINITNDVPPQVKETADGLVYRDFIVAGVLLDELAVKDKNNEKLNMLIKDTWIYVQEPDVQLGRVQIFNNWSPYLPRDFKKQVWIGLEYFCNEQDSLWNLSEKDFCSFAIAEAEKIGLIKSASVIDCCRHKVKKAYPAYFGTYKNFDTVKDYVNRIENLFLIGRNGMHRYNNMDHSVLSAFTAVDNIVSGRKDKNNIWAVNTEQEYHEKRNA